VSISSDTLLTALLVYGYPVLFGVVLAALGRYPLSYFAGVAAAGELVWTGAFVGLGYAFGESWSTVVEWVDDSAGLLAGLCVAGIGLALLVWLPRNRGVEAPVQSAG